VELDYSRTDCDIWLFNEAKSNPDNEWAKRADVVFQMHAEPIWRNPGNRNDKNHADWLKTQREVVVYMQEQYIDVPMSKKYPLEEVCQALHFNKRYFTSSVSYALALASYLGYKKIELYGVEMETDTEYRYQRDGVTFWVGVAVGKGIEFELHCGMMQAPLYGYDGDAKLDYSVFVESIAEISAKMPELETSYNASRQQTAALVEQFINDGKDGEQIVKSVQVQLSTGIRFGTLDGAKQENERYKKKADAMTQTTGEFIFSRQEFESAKQALQKKQMELMTKSNVLAGQTEAAFKQAEGLPNKNRRRARMTEFVKVLDAYIRITITTAMIIGGLNENTRYLNQLDNLIKAAGGEKSEEVLLNAYRA
jgi:hypothetical protein